MARIGPRLPGVYFAEEALPPADALPRMDVAGFVGFAASGPVGAPVPVDDLGRFRDVFGPDVELARDPEGSGVRRSLLGPAVEAFFANGGRRCWIVRVADEAAARTLAFALPGLSLPGGGAVEAVARSPGVWAAALAVGCRVERRRLDPGGEPLTLSASSWSATLAAGATPPVAGDLLELAWRGEAPGERRLALAVVDGVEAAAGRVMAWGARVFWYAPATAEGPLGVENPDLVAAPALAAPGAPDLVHRLTLELSVWRGARREARLSGLGFAAAHPRFWGRLPDDRALFAPLSGRPRPEVGPETAALLAEASSPRFPLAAPRGAPTLTLPLGMAAVADRSLARAPDPPEGTALELDGLARFDDALFLDPDFAATPAGALLDTMGAKQSASLAPFGVAEGAPIRGLHSLLTVEEVSMVAVPDALHRRWSRALPEPSPALDAPWLEPVPPRLDAFGRAALNWSGVDGAALYRVEATTEAGEAGAVLMTTPSPGCDLPLPEACPTVWRFRVRAERRGEVGPWSNERIARIPGEDFEACEGPDPLLPALRLESGAAGSPPDRALRWAPDPAEPLRPGDAFELEEAVDPTMAGARRLRRPDASATEWTPPPASDGARYYRVRLVRGGEAGPWSNTLRVEPSARAGWAMAEVAEHETGPLVAVHRALIRFCAARADAVAMLALPSHYREAEVAAHLSELVPSFGRGETAPGGAGTLGVPPLGFDETGALSYAALFHPWIATEGATGFRPPDGAACGLVAQRALTTGPWTAAANAPIRGGLALSPKLDAEAVARLIALHANPVVRDARGFLFLNAETLSLTEEVRPLPVRRLMILLRRLALREGATYVFEPHSADFRATVRRRFERLLSIIHQRGGFVGPGEKESFTVVVDEAVNPPVSVDLGRLIVELRVAPSRPFRFLNVRLLQTGPQGLEVREG